MADERDYRLPRTVIPSRYELTLEPDLGTSTFAGFESVAVEVREPIDEVVLNAIELDIDEAWLEDPTGERVDAAVTLDEERERAHLALASTVAAGPWTVHIRFRGALNDKLRGFYRSTFTDEAGEERVIATTQFEATDARRAFPCWDEPDLKAVFSVSLVVAEGLTALSNASEVATEDAPDGRRVVRFADTMVMSTYLVAFIVGPLELTEPVDVDGVPLRIAHVPGKGHLTRYALETGAFSLRFFADYYGIPYPGDKLDLVALPDFAFGAMENLGCVTFREALLVVDPDSVTHDELQRVADVIAHEIAHMWFGDLVTMRWWNGIWLNEAFATFMELACVDAYKPEWDRWVSFGLERSSAFDVDSLTSTRPIEYPVLSPHDAEGMFDVLTYQKGAAVLRMLERYLDGDAFRDGIRHYLGTHRYGNTETTDLWDALEEVTGQPTRRIMDSWIFQGGYPVVRVETDLDGKVLRLTQRRFSFSDDVEDTSWAIPIILSFGTDGAAQVRKILLDGDALEIDLPEPVEWVVANAGGHGFYRVGYSAELLKALTSRAQRQLTPIERYGLVDDAWASVLAGDLPAPTFLELVRGFGDEADAAVWKRIVGALASLDRVLDGEARPRFQGFVRALLGPVLRRMGWEPGADENELARDLRGTLVRALGVLGDDAEVHDRVKALHDGPDRERVDPAIMAAAVDVLAAAGGPDRFDQYVDCFKNAPTPQEQLRYLYALGSFPEEDLVRRALEMAVGGEVRSQNAPFLINRALNNRTNGAAAWRFVRQSWDALNDRLPSNSIVRMLEGVRSLSDPTVANDVFSFFAEHEVPQGARTLEQHLDRLRVNLALREREAERLAASLP